MEISMSAITEMADRLGKLIAESSQFKAIQAAEKELNDNAEAKKLMEEYGLHADKVSKLEAENKPIEVADKHKLQELRDKLSASDVFKRYTAAQVDYVDMMRQVNQAIQKHLG